jgi:hypothetical protein
MRRTGNGARVLRAKFAILLLAATLASCATPETRIRTALVDAGLTKPVATCMAGRMVDRLSLLQLNKLRGLGKLKGRPVRGITVEEFVERTKALQDPEILGVVTSSGVVCALSS